MGYTGDGVFVHLDLKKDGLDDLDRLKVQAAMRYMHKRHDTVSSMFDTLRKGYGDDTNFALLLCSINENETTAMLNMLFTEWIEDGITVSDAIFKTARQKHAGYGLRLWTSS